MKEYCNIYDAFILLVLCIFHFLMGISLTMNVSNIYPCVLKSNELVIYLQQSKIVDINMKKIKLNVCVCVCVHTGG